MISDLSLTPDLIICILQKPAQQTNTGNGKIFVDTMSEISCAPDMYQHAGRTNQHPHVRIVGVDSNWFLDGELS